MTLLRKGANGLRAPLLSSAFAQWGRVADEARREAEHRAFLKANESLEGQLRFAHYELGQANIVKTALEDEVHGRDPHSARTPTALSLH